MKKPKAPVFQSLESSGYWLFKSEPDEFGIEHLKKSPKQATIWSGVRNYTARNFMRDKMSVGDKGFFYHSSCEVPGVAGIVMVSKTGLVDPTQFDAKSDYFDPSAKKDSPRWITVEVVLKERFGNVLPLAELKTNKRLSGMLILAPGNRLSITPVSAAHWNEILGMIETRK